MELSDINKGSYREEIILRRRKKKQLQMMAILLAFLAILVALVILVVFTLLKGCGKSKLESITMTADFAENELDINRDYTFTIKGNPDTAKLKDLEVIVEGANVTYNLTEDNTSATIHTVGEGDLEICVKDSNGVESNHITLRVVDQAAAEAAKAAEDAARAAEEAAAAAAAEAQAAEELEPREAYVRTNDKVRIRKSPSTDTNDNIITTCEIGEVYKRLDTVDDWSRIVYEDGEAYIKSEFLDILSDEEAQEALDAQKAKSVEDALKKAEDESRKATENDPVAAAAAEAAKAQEDAAKAAEDAAKAAEEAAAAQAAQAAAAAASGTQVRCKDGTATFTQNQVNYFHGLWDYTGQYEEMVSHHTIGELRELCQNNGIN